MSPRIGDGPRYSWCYLTPPPSEDTFSGAAEVKAGAAVCAAISPVVQGRSAGPNALGAFASPPPIASRRDICLL